MPDSLAETAPLAAHQRASGELRLTAKSTDRGSSLDTLRQSGCLRARFPRLLVPGWLDVVTLNTSGGIAGGDRLATTLEIGPNAQATIAAQAAERFYRRIPDTEPSTVRTAITVHDHATAEWLPQETILFDNSALDRRLDVILAPTATFLGLETLVFGRTAMGETVHTAWVRDLIRITRGDTLLLHDAIRLDGNVAALLQRSAVAGGGRAVGTLIYTAPDAETRLPPIREALANAPAEAAASAWNGMLITRIVARDGAALRRTIIAALPALRDNRPLPRVWMC